MRFRPCQATTVGQRPVLADGEIIIHLQPEIGLYNNEDRLDKYGNGTGYLTNHRFIWCDGGTALAIPLVEVAAIDGQAGFLASHAKIILRLLPPPTPFSTATPTALTPTSTSTVKWICGICEAVEQILSDSDELKCGHCGVKTAMAQALLICPACTFHNQPPPNGRKRGSNGNCEICGTDFKLVTPPQTTLIPANNGSQPNNCRDYVKLSFRGGGQLPFLEKMRDAHRARAWLVTASPATATNSTSDTQIQFNPLAAGISGIVKNVAEMQLQTERNLEGAFKDLDALIREAEEMVSLAEALSSKLREAQSPDENSEFQMMMLNMGISNPVTKEIAGSLYHLELARQLSDFLDKLLPQSGGIIPLTDIYCIFNRARGVALISPEDLYKACLEFERLELPMKLHRFSSGLLVVKSDRYSEQAIVDRIMAYLDSRQFITSLELAESENISSSLALEQLLAVERIAKVCRDEAVEGLRFYSNDILLHNEKAHAHVDE